MNNDYYNENSSKTTIEIAELQEDILLSKVADTNGKFLINTLTPNDTNQIMSLKIPKYIIYQFIELTMEKVSVKSNLFTTIGKAKYHLLNNSYNDGKIKIPKGTKFLVCFIGGEIRYERIKIIGIY